MSGRKYQHTLNGQEVREQDLNLIAQQGALADDRVLSDLYRLAPYDGSTYDKRVLPYGYRSNGTVLPATVAPSGSADGKVRIYPFTALLGSRVAVGTDSRRNWKDIRSAIFVPGAPDPIESTIGTTLYAAQGFTANISGASRWDLVYAVLTVDAASNSTTRKVKDPSTSNITNPTIQTEYDQLIAIGVVAGTPAVTPAFPSLPADNGIQFYFPLAYVRIPNGYGASTTIVTSDIIDAAPTVGPHSSTGGLSCKPASSQFDLLTGAGHPMSVFPWPSAAAGARPGHFMPPTMVGMASRMIALDLSDAAHANWSHDTGAVVDDSIDWRYRIFRSFVAAHSGYFAWSQPANAGAHVPGYNTGFAGLGSTHTMSMGQSCYDDSLAGSFGSISATNFGVALWLAPSQLSQMAASSVVALYVDWADGKLKLYANTANSPLCRFFIWLDASAPFPNL